MRLVEDWFFLYVSHFWLLPCMKGDIGEGAEGEFQSVSWPLEHDYEFPRYVFWLYIFPRYSGLTKSEFGNLFLDSVSADPYW